MSLKGNEPRPSVDSFMRLESGVQKMGSPRVSLRRPTDAITSPRNKAATKSKPRAFVEPEKSSFVKTASTKARLFYSELEPPKEPASQMPAMKGLDRLLSKLGKNSGAEETSNS